MGSFYNPGMFDVSLHTLVSLIALGMALAFLVPDARSRTSQALSVSLAATGIGIFLNVSLIDPAAPPSWSGWLALPEAIALGAMLEWLLRVRQTIPASSGMNTRFGDRMLRCGQGAALSYALFSILAPELRINYFMHAGFNPEIWRDWRFWLFAVPVDFSALAGFVAILLLLNRKPDRVERMRVLAMAGGVPFFLAAFVLPLELGALSCVIGEIILLVGSVNYYMQQGQRGQFMARFLSPDVARLVGEHGLSRAMQEDQITITVVCSDLRGFTPFAADAPSAQVLRVLREYYDAVGVVVAEVGGTIKDYAGDGILILVGAPIAMTDHAQRGVLLSQRIRDVCMDLSKKWQSEGWTLGIGVGVASGSVTVGVIGSTSLEYTAVGSAVNLASRLCEQAGDGEILIDACTREMLPDQRFEARAPLQVKGFSEPIDLFAAST